MPDRSYLAVKPGEADERPSGLRCMRRIQRRTACPRPQRRLLSQMRRHENAVAIHTVEPGLFTIRAFPRTRWKRLRDGLSEEEQTLKVRWSVSPPRRYAKRHLRPLI